MTFDIKYFKLFQEGTIFDQIVFLDNFYDNILVDNVQEQDINKLLTIAITQSNNSYIKRSAFKILCQLALAKIIKNRFSVLAIIQDFLYSNESSFQVIALKYLPYFAEFRDNNIESVLKELTDSLDGDVASQAYFCLGLIELTKAVSTNSITESILMINSAKPHFIAAVQSTENRVDADFYLLLIDCIKVLINNFQSAPSKFDELKKNLLLRNLYEFTEQELKLDFLVFQLIEQIKYSLEIVSKAKEWLEMPPQIEALFRISLEIQSLRTINSSNQFLIDRLYSNLFENVESNIYKLNLLSEKKRLQVLLSKTNDPPLKIFIEYLIGTLPNNLGFQFENLDLLALLSDNLGSEEGLQLYNQINDKTVSTEILSAINSLLSKNHNNQLPYRTGSIYGQEVFLLLKGRIISFLPNYPEHKLDSFLNILEEIIRYARTTFVENDKKRFHFLFAESENGKGQKAIEQDLQDSMIVFFDHSKIADGLGHEKAKFVDAGRVDIVYKKDLITIPIEIKKTLSRQDQETLEKNYIAQAQTYTAGYDQLGLLVLLELSDKANDPPPNFKDWFKIHHLKPSSDLPTNYPDYVISAVIPGNRTTPSKKSTYI